MVFVTFIERFLNMVILLNSNSEAKMHGDLIREDTSDMILCKKEKLLSVTTMSDQTLY